MYAVIEVLGKQFFVKVGDVFYVDSLRKSFGCKVDDMTDFVPIFVFRGEKEIFTEDKCEGTIVKTKVLKEGLGKKIRVFKYKAKKNYKKAIGFRRHYTKLEVVSIS